MPIAKTVKWYLDSHAVSYEILQHPHTSTREETAHAVWRSVVLVLLGIFLISNGRDSTNWSLMNVLTQIGLGYALQPCLAPAAGPGSFGHPGAGGVV